MRGSNSGRGKRLFSFLKRPDPLWDLLGLLFSRYRGPFPRVKRPGREDNHSSPSSANVHECSFTSVPPTRLHDLDCDKVTVTLRNTRRKSPCQQTTSSYPPSEAWKMFWITYKIQFQVKRKHSVFSSNKKVTALYCGNHMEDLSILCGRTEGFFHVTAGYALTDSPALSNTPSVNISFFKARQP